MIWKGVGQGLGLGRHFQNSPEATASWKLVIFCKLFFSDKRKQSVFCQLAITYGPNVVVASSTAPLSCRAVVTTLGKLFTPVCLIHQAVLIPAKAGA